MKNLHFTITYNVSKKRLKRKLANTKIMQIHSKYKINIVHKYNVSINSNKSYTLSFNNLTKCKYTLT